MRRSIVLLAAAVLFGSMFATAAESKGPPRYLWVQYEQLQPGKAAPYMELTQTYRDMVDQTSHYWIAGMPVVATGNEFALTYLIFLEDFANMDRMLADFDKTDEVFRKKNAKLMDEGMSAIASLRALVAEYQPELSLNVDRIDPAYTTRWVMTTYHLRPGTRAKFTQLLSRVRQLAEAEKNPASVMVYQVVIGEPGPVFLIVKPLRTLAELDQKAAAPENPLRASIVGEQFAAAVAECVITQTEALYTVSPSLSHPPESYVAVNPGFWKVKLAEPAVAAAGKKGRKAVQPASIKE